ncbi:MAG: hypothetical protein VX069_05015, partial [Cyanobacteriota bacterium]|nr:hypothetical protein [Cyanobacteriota bacterium]
MTASWLKSSLLKSSLGLLSVLVLTSPVQAQSRLDRLLAPRRPMGVWLTNSPSPLYYDRQRIRLAMEQLQEAGFDRVVPNVWSRG